MVTRSIEPRVVRLEPDRDLHQDRVAAQPLAQLLGDPHRVGAGAIALVDEGEAGHAVATQLAVDGDRLRLDPGHGAQHQHRPVEHAQRPLDLDREVDVARGVDDVDLMVVPVDVGRRRGDRDAALALELERVHGGADAVAAVDLVHAVDAAGVVEDPLGEGRLPRVDVGADADVPDEAPVDHWRSLAWGSRQVQRLGEADAAGHRMPSEVHPGLSVGPMARILPGSPRSSTDEPCLKSLDSRILGDRCLFVDLSPNVDTVMRF